MTSRRFEGHDPRAGHDTAGVPWSGRTLSGTGFDGDTGGADPRLVQALAGLGCDDDEVTLLAAVSGARMLVPVVAVPGESPELDDRPNGHSGDRPNISMGDRPHGLSGEVSSDMAAITLVAADGAKALPAFTSLEAMAGWDPSARPVPVTAQRAALAAVQEGCDSIVLDVGTRTSYALRPSMVWALATARAWTPAYLDSHVDAAVSAAVAAEPAATAYTLAAGAGGALRITLSLRPGLGQDDVRTLVTRIGEHIATDGEVRARIDALTFTLREG